MKTSKNLVTLAAFCLFGACATSPGSDSPLFKNLGGNANSDNGKAFIAAIKGKVYSDAALTTEMPVADNGDITERTHVYRFAGAPSKTTAYYYSRRPAYDPRHPR